MNNFIEFEGKDIFFKLPHIDPDQAYILTTARAESIYLNELKTISAEVADQLSLFDGMIFLNGLQEIDDVAAAVFSKFRNWLFLDGLTSISENACRSLAKIKGGLSLDGLKDIPENKLNILTLMKGHLYLGGLSSITEKEAEILARHEGPLFLTGLKTLSKETAYALAKHEGELHLDGLSSLSDEAAEALCTHNGGIAIDNLNHFSERIAEMLMDKELVYDFSNKEEEYDESDSEYALLAFTDYEQLSVEEAKKIVSKNPDRIFLDEVDDLSAEVVEILANHTADLSLNGLTRITDEVAGILSKHRGNNISLNGLYEISDVSAEALSKHDGNIELKGLKKISENAMILLLLRGFIDKWIHSRPE
jgi:hypothetical protein